MFGCVECNSSNFGIYVHRFKILGVVYLRLVASGDELCEMWLRSDLVNDAAIRRISRHWGIALGQGQILGALVSQILEKIQCRHDLIVS
jgi:hypothetical protein